MKPTFEQYCKGCDDVLAYVQIESRIFGKDYTMEQAKDIAFVHICLDYSDANRAISDSLLEHLYYECDE